MGDYCTPDIMVKDREQTSELYYACTKMKTA